MTSENTSNLWTARQATVMAAICLVLGLAIGYFGHGPAQPLATAAQTAPTNAAGGESMAPPISTPAPSADQMKAASAKAAGTVLDQLEKDPKNFKLLVAAGEMYYHHGSFEKAGSYYQRALQVEDRPEVRDRYASALFYEGKSDEALAQYSQVLQKDSKNELALFNSGMIRLKSKNDPKGAIEQWQKLLAAYPNHPKRDQVQALIDQAKKKQG